jgi:hypothetical protein
MRASPTVVTKTDVDSGSGRYIVSGEGNYTDGTNIQALPTVFTMHTPQTSSSNATKCGFTADAEL